jgi:septum formation protein
MKILLASQSPYRKQQLKDLGLRFTAKSPKFDEDSLKGQGIAPRALALRLAIEKARSLVARHPDYVIIGADQLVALGKKVLGKPGSAKNAVKQLQMMSGKTHELVTALAVIYKGKVWTKTVVASVKLHRLSEKEIRAYVKRDRPLDCAGSYKFEHGGFSLVESMQVSDPSSLIGLPLIELSAILRNISRRRGS